MEQKLQEFLKQFEGQKIDVLELATKILQFIEKNK